MYWFNTEDDKKAQIYRVRVPFYKTLDLADSKNALSNGE